MTCKVYSGDCREVMKTLQKESIDLVVTSPPYWGLRDYKTEPVAWDGSSDCNHEWEDDLKIKRHKAGETNPGKESWYKDNGTISQSGGKFCSLCGAWLGQLGLEPSPELFIKHLLDVFDLIKPILKDTGSVVNFPEDKKTEYNRYYNSLVAKTDSIGAITTKTDSDNSTITSITSPIISKTDNVSRVITTITQNGGVSGGGTNITDSNIMDEIDKSAIHSKLCNNGNNPATAIDIDGNNPGNSGNSLSTNNDFIINSGNSQVIDIIKQAGKEWERTRGQSISTSNITDFCMWYCEHIDKKAKPSFVRAIAEMIFKITPEQGNSGGYLLLQSELQSGQSIQKDERRIQDINDDLSLKLRKYHQFFKQDVKAGKGVSSLAKKELKRGNMKTAFREYFVHNCPEYMQERGKVDYAISTMQNKGELQ